MLIKAYLLAGCVTNDKSERLLVRQRKHISPEGKTVLFLRTINNSDKDVTQVLFYYLLKKQS